VYINPIHDGFGTGNPYANLGVFYMRTMSVKV
jgi:hypothetical protein